MIKVEPEPMSGCWLWLGTLNHEGYGDFTVAYKRTKAHRFAYTTFVAPIPEGLQIDHLCRNRACVNPGHLEAVTPLTNLRRSTHRLFATHRTGMCASGRHPLDAQNTAIRQNGRRRCRACDAERARLKRARISAVRHERNAA